jgi:hypothetical protein
VGVVQLDGHLLRQLGQVQLGHPGASVEFQYKFEWSSNFYIQFYINFTGNSFFEFHKFIYKFREVSLWIVFYEIMYIIQILVGKILFLFFYIFTSHVSKFTNERNET